MIWRAKNGDRCAAPPEQLVQSEYVRVGYGMSDVAANAKQMNARGRGSRRAKEECKKKRIRFKDVIAARMV